MSTRPLPCRLTCYVCTVYLPAASRPQFGVLPPRLPPRLRRGLFLTYCPHRLFTWCRVLNGSVAVRLVFTSSFSLHEWPWNVACPCPRFLVRIVASLRWMWEWLQAWVTHAAFVFLRLMVRPADTAGSYPRLRWLVSLPNSSLTWKALLLVLMSPPWRSCPNRGYLLCDRAFRASRAFFPRPAFGISGLCRASNVECRRSALALLAAQAQS